ncbi:hypothetical protein C9374_004384 [Naegleria lovaniensis]|uniref:Uncharacterized protein n=1 Tax=Naegleria lovaniensis TaxID=51637 RepID=A0AA88GT93_NAELO|nr:uncharacterized protein C9374_004384 [Naegleria lovaniensis]KAG2383713.1 hypothetical protein C9374_004384 [Naegleria lovaniensis]
MDHRNEEIQQSENEGSMVDPRNEKQQPPPHATTSSDESTNNNEMSWIISSPSLLQNDPEINNDDENHKISELHSLVESKTMEDSHDLNSSTKSNSSFSRVETPRKEEKNFSFTSPTSQSITDDSNQNTIVIDPMLTTTPMSENMTTPSSIESKSATSISSANTTSGRQSLGPFELLMQRLGNISNDPLGNSINTAIPIDDNSNDFKLTRKHPIPNNNNLNQHSSSQLSINLVDDSELDHLNFSNSSTANNKRGNGSTFSFGFSSFPNIKLQDNPILGSSFFTKKEEKPSESLEVLDCTRSNGIINCSQDEYEYDSERKIMK